MNARQLIKILIQYEDYEELMIKVIENEEGKEHEFNYWLHSVEVSVKGQSGYEVGGEIRLIGEE